MPVQTGFNSAWALGWRAIRTNAIVFAGFDIPARHFDPLLGL
jgi:hypothetical protein